MNTQFYGQKHFYFKLFSLFKQLCITIQVSVSTVLMSKTVQFQTIQFSISTQFKCKYSLIVKKHFYFKLFNLIKQFSLAKVSRKFYLTQR